MNEKEQHRGVALSLAVRLIMPIFYLINQAQGLRGMVNYDLISLYKVDFSKCALTFLKLPPFRLMIVKKLCFIVFYAENAVIYQSLLLSKTIPSDERSSKNDG